MKNGKIWKPKQYIVKHRTCMTFNSKSLFGKQYSEFNFQWSTLNSWFYNLRASANSKIISPK